MTASPVPARPVPGPARCLGGLITAMALLLVGDLPGDPALAQSERFLLGPGSTVGPGTQVEPKNCVTAQDGTITCDTKLVNPEGSTPARPIFEPFRN